MREIIGNLMDIYFKYSKFPLVGDVRGLLIDVSEDNIYVQDEDFCSKIYVIPRDNIGYCITDKLPTMTRQLIEKPPEISHETEDPVLDHLEVYVNKEHIVNISVPPTFSLHKWNENILKVMMGNPDVQNAVAGLVQEEIEYFPGKAYIKAAQIEPPSQMPEKTNENTFSTECSPTTEYLNPLQMVERLNKVVGGNKDGKTKM